jgi:hypothetical protein
MSDLIPARGAIFATIPAEPRDAGWHRPGRRQLVIYLRGEVEQAASDAQVRRVGPGDVILAEDTTGKGHRTRVLGGEQLVVIIPLAG